MTTIAFDIAHPKHFYQFRYAIDALRADHQVRILAKDKDVVLQLLTEVQVPFLSYGRHRQGIGQKLLGLPSTAYQYLEILRRIRPRVIVSKSSPYAAMLGRVVGARTVVMPDSEGVAVNERLVIPLSDDIVTPRSFERDYGSRHHRVSGFFESAYLHPRHFAPDPDAARDLCQSAAGRFVLLRFVGWGASHDAGQRGIEDADKIRLVQALAPHASVFVSVEGRLPAELEPYRLRSPASKLHHVLAAAALYIGDSQTMATEAALLGTPCIRCNSFVGANDFSNFRILERDFGLLYNTVSVDEALERAVTLLNDPTAKARWRDKRDRYFATVGDVNDEVLRTLREIVGREARPKSVRTTSGTMPA